MSSLRGQVRAGSSRRDDFPLRRSKTALLVIDVQTYVTSPPQSISPEGDYLWNQAVPRMVRNLQLLLQAFRAARDEPDDSSVAGGCEVIFTYLQAATNDGRDISLDYKLSGPQLAGIPRVGEKDLFLSQLQPDLETGKGDILLPKTSCSVFQSTNLNYLLRNLGIDQLVVAGQLTD
jgi:nicotinamidase-related amidase